MAEKRFPAGIEKIPLKLGNKRAFQADYITSKLLL
jgi:hypothetical protein